MMLPEWIRIPCDSTLVMNVPGGCVFRSDGLNGLAAVMCFAPMVQIMKDADGAGFVSTMAEFMQAGFQIGKSLAVGVDAPSMGSDTPLRAVCSEPGCNGTALPSTGKCAPHSFSSAEEAASGPSAPEAPRQGQMCVRLGCVDLAAEGCGFYCRRHYENGNAAAVAPTEGEKCGRCDGCGRIADGEEGAPWSVWESMPLNSSAAVLAGMVKPIMCPACRGTGKAVRP
jgi:hypothetical protein